MTKPEKLVTSLDVSREVAEVLGYGVNTCWVWARRGITDPGCGAKYFIGDMELLHSSDDPKRIPAYTVTELASMVTFPIGFHISANPDDMALDVLSQIKRDTYDFEDEDTTVDSCLRNLREWQATSDES